MKKPVGSAAWRVTVHLFEIDRGELTAARTVNIKPAIAGG
jgi:hypothetical protein